MFRFLGVGVLVMVTVAGCGDEALEQPSSSAASVSEAAPQETVHVTSDATEVVSDLVYADGVALDIHLPALSGDRPVVVFAHGSGGSKISERAIGRALAESGAVVYQPDLVDEHPFLETVQQVACAVRYARATAATYGGDPDNVAMVGFSMGAATGVIVGLSGDDFTAGCVENEASALPDVFVGYEGPYDWARSESPSQLQLLEREDPVLWAKIDPYSHIGRHPDLIVRLIHGVDEDTQWYDVAPQVSQDFERALSAAGYDVELTLVEGAAHMVGFAGLGQFDEIVEQTLRATATIENAHS